MATDSPPEASKPALLEAGTVIADRYRVVEQLGEGGMGVVYSVEHTHMRKLFALKVLHRELLRMPEVVSRFEREAVLAGSINHPNVAAATDFGKLPDGSFFLILELVVGKSLRALIAEGPVEVTRALPIMRGMTAGIVAAHAKGIVHRDLKPDNVMLVERDGVSDFVKVLDFGIAKGDAMPEAQARTGGGGGQPLTQIGTIMGTPDYMSPEQAVGQTVDQRSDLYSLGVIFFELITGAALFQGDGLQVLRQHLTTVAPPIPAELVAGVAVPIAPIVAKLLAKEPEARFQSAAELLAALDGVSPRATAPSVPLVLVEPEASATSVRPPPRQRMVVGAGALGGLVLMMIVVAILFTRRDPIAATDIDASTGTGLVSTPASASGEAAASADEGAPPPTASASADLAETGEEAPSAAAPASTAVPAAGRGNRGRRTPPARTAPRRTGPGGIYIPPPKDWFR